MIAGEAWKTVQGIESRAGEARVNVIRLAGLLVFYGHHLINYHFLAPKQEGVAAALVAEHHQRATIIVALWTAMAAALFVAARRRWSPAWLTYASAVGDTAMITLLATISDGPRSSLVTLYFVTIAAAALRLSLGLVWTATAAAAIGYLALVARYAWVVVGYDAYYAADGPRLPRVQQVIVLLALATTGLLAGQIVRQTKRVVEAFTVADRETS